MNQLNLNSSKYIFITEPTHGDVFAFLELSNSIARGIGSFEDMAESDTYVLFESMDHPNTTFLMAHGSDEKDGRVWIGNETLTSEEVLKYLLSIGCTQNILTICCYGGFQESCTIDGITISSIHDCKERVGIQKGCYARGYYIKIQSEFCHDSDDD